jgi:UDP-3-O-[3-hydroxymyristoyl] glucosamine N-acyltransferase
LECGGASRRFFLQLQSAPVPGVPIQEIVELVGGRYDGPADRVIRGVATLAEAAEDQISFLSNPRYAQQLATTSAGAILVSNDLEGDDARYVRVANPYLAWARVIERWFVPRPALSGISPLASIAPSATLGANVAIGPFTTIGDDVAVGDDTIIYSNVAVYPGSIIGRRCIVHSGTVIGADGYGFVVENGRHRKVPQIGIVRIGDDVEIGAGCTIDRASIGETLIGEGTKIDDQVMIGHGAKVGRHCLLVAQVGIAGSTELGDYVVVAGQSGFAGHLKIGDRVQVAAKSAVLHDVPADTKVMGNPAMPFRDFARREAWLKRTTKERK